MANEPEDSVPGKLRIKHTHLRRLYERGETRGLPPQYAERLREMLLHLEAANSPHELDLPGWRLHPLKGGRAGQWSVRVSRNWRIVFRFKDGVATDVDLIDYH